MAPPAIEEAALSAIKAEQRIPLCRAIDLMAFGGGNLPRLPLKIVAKRQQAATALFDAAKHSRVSLIGHPGPQGNTSEPITPTYFDDARCLGHDDNTIETKTSDIGMPKYVAIRGDRNHKHFPVWSHVRVETKTFLRWLESQRPSSKVHNEDKCKNWLIEQMRKSPTERSGPKATYFEQAQRRFSGTSKRGFDILWREAVKESGASAWAKPGAPRK